MGSRKFASYCAPVMGVLALAAFSTGAHAQATLTPAATSVGFTLSTFALGFSANSGGAGPLATLNNPDGTLLQTDYAGGYFRVFNDVDNQTVASSVQAVPYGFQNPTGLARVGSQAYMTEQNSGLVVKVGNDGSFQGFVASIGGATGLVADPVTGHLLVSNGSPEIYDVNPSNGAVTSYLSGYDADGLTFAPDGSELFAAINGNSVEGFMRGSSTPFFTTSVAGADGTAMGTGTLAGNIFVNSNFGTLYEVNVASGIQTEIFSGGSRGDFVSVDSNNGSLIVSQTDRMLRLTAPSGSSFGATAPLPASGWMGVLLVGFVGALQIGKRLGHGTQAA